MEFYIPITCGDKTLRITKNTNYGFRMASREDCLRFESSHWLVPEPPENNLKFWNALWPQIHGSIKKDELCKRIYSAFADRIEIPNGRFPQEIKMFTPVLSDNVKLGVSYNLSLGYKKICMNYPEDYLKLINVITQYLMLERLLNVEPQKLAEMDIPLNIKKLVSVVEPNKEYIESFKEYESAYIANKEQIEQTGYHYFHSLNNQYFFRLLFVDDELFFEAYCGFDIERKYDEISAAIKKIKESNNDGENAVEYAIKWLLAESNESVVSITPDCSSKYRYGCIQLFEPEFIDEPQEYDHILVCAAGVILIETKHWAGRIEIRPDGKWLRDKNNDGQLVGAESPAFQMHRHELLMKKILPETPIYSVLCFSNGSAIIDGKENFNDFPIVYVDKLKETLSDIFSSRNLAENEIKQIVEQIEKHKTNKLHIV